jgi:hypothetical protein
MQFAMLISYSVTSQVSYKTAVIDPIDFHDHPSRCASKETLGDNDINNCNQDTAKPRRSSILYGSAGNTHDTTISDRWVKRRK